MRAFSYVGNTWLLAQFIHPSIFYLFYVFVLNGHLDMGAIVSLFVCSLVLSLPALAASALFIRVLPVMHMPLKGNLFIWLILANASILINVALFALLMGDERLFFNEWSLYLPAILAAVASIFLRYNQFKRYVNYQNSLYEDQDDLTSTYEM